MNPNLFSILKNNSTVVALLGLTENNTTSVLDSAGDAVLDSNGDPILEIVQTVYLRVFPYGRAPEKVAKPYAVYSVINGRPENYLDTTPNIDSKLTQISIYAETDSSLTLCYNAVRDVLEPYAHMVSFSTPDIDADTNLSSCRIDFEFWDER